jgi:methionyl-tRNA formyltransferase
MKAVVFAYSNVGDRCLRVLHARGVEVVLVVTHEDQPGELIWFSRVADTAVELDIPFVFSERVDDSELAVLVRQARPDVIFSFYYRAMLPMTILTLAPKGAFNMHGSLLPKYRGRAPTNWAVLHGETETGATLHEMVAQPDAGDIVDQSAVPILPDDTAKDVFDKVTVAAEQVLWRTLPAIESGQIPRRPNRLAEGSYFGGRKPEDGRIDWSLPAPLVYDLIRAVAPPYPGAFTDIAGRRLVVAAARRVRPGRLSSPGNHYLGLAVIAERIVGFCGDGQAIDVLELRLDAARVDARLLTSLLRAQQQKDETA